MQIELHVTKGKGRWHLTVAPAMQEGFRTQRAAIAAGRRMARKHRLELVIHGENGLIREKDSQGWDSPKRKG